jgi:type I restriction enzyme R subunit
LDRNWSAKADLALTGEALKSIDHKLVKMVCRDAETDWAVKQQVQAKLSSTVNRLLRKYG